MTNLSQKQRIIRKLRIDGYVSRNEALKNYISRLSAIIQNIEREGWTFHARHSDDKKDYIYEVINKPYREVNYYVPELGKTIIKIEQKNGQN